MVNVLIVDDNLNMRESLKACLPYFLKDDFQVPVSVRTAGTGEEAEPYLQWAELAIVDKNIDTGHRSGFDVINRIKDVNPSVYTILFSGEVREYAARECQFDEFVPKDEPINRLYRIIVSFHRRQMQPSLSPVSTIRTPLDRYLEELKKDMDFDSELHGNYPNSELNDELFKRLTEEFGERNFEFGDAFDVDGNLIPYDKGLRGIYVRRQKPEENPT